MCRLYLYPRIVLLSTGSLAKEIIPEGPFYFFFNAMLWMLFGLNLYWFHFIMWLVIRVVSGTSRELEDTREIPQSKKVQVYMNKGCSFQLSLNRHAQVCVSGVCSFV